MALLTMQNEIHSHTKKRVQLKLTHLKDQSEVHHYRYKTKANF